MTLAVETSKGVENRSKATWYAQQVRGCILTVLHRTVEPLFGNIRLRILTSPVSVIHHHHQRTTPVTSRQVIIALVCAH
jgi:hypothetical protein